MNINYIAGFFDGEGCIVNCESKKRCRYTLAISQTNFEVLEKIREYFGVGKVYSLKKRKAHWKDAWVYKTTNAPDTLKVLKELKPHLILDRKKELAQAAIDYIENFVSQRRDLKSNSLSEDEITVIKLIKEGNSYRTIHKETGIGRQTIVRIKDKSERIDHERRRKRKARKN